MSTCTKWVDKGVIQCSNWAEKLDHECTTWADEGSQQCSQWADEGSQGCSKYADEGSNECASKYYSECHWYSPWNCIAGWLCSAYYWVAKWVCKAYYWIAKWVCKAFAWIVKAVCKVWSWIAKLVCLAWDTLVCALLAVGRWVGSLFGRAQTTPRKIEHVFLLALENRAFDHMLGFSGLEGTDAVTGQPTTIAGLNPAIHKNLDPTTSLDVAVSSPADFYLKNVDIDPGHEFGNVLHQLCGKAAVYSPVPGGYPAINNSGFIQDYLDSGSSSPARIMKCFSPEQLPVMHTLASEFAVCDNWFSSLPGPTWPNRFFMLAASSGGLDDSPGKADLVAATTLDGFRFENGHIFDALDAKCIDWKIFEGDEFPVSFALSGMNLNALQGRFKDFDDFGSELAKVDFSPKFVFIEPRYGEDEFDATGPGDYACGNSMHPLNDVTRGEKLIKKVYETIRNSPHWEKSLLIITFDEHGGFYDHVAPPAAVPPGDLETAANVKNGFKFDRLGVRVPAIIVSPWIRKGTIDHTCFDHTSGLATVERLFGLGNLTERDKAAKDLLHLLSLDTARTDAPTALPPAAVSGFVCEDDDGEETVGRSAESLIASRSELLAEKHRVEGPRSPLLKARPTQMQLGWTYIALMKLLQVSEYPEREQWKTEFQAIATGMDVALFMTEAKLKLAHCVDIKKMLRAARCKQPARGRSKQGTQ